MKRCSLILFMVLFSIGFAMAQRTVTGTVSDELGDGLIGANVFLKGTTSGTVTDIEGKFSLNVPADAASNTLVISYTGYATQEVDITAVNDVIVSLVEGETLSEVVVTGYSSIKKPELTGSAVQVSAEEIAQLPVATVDQVLQGKVAGLVFNNQSGTPGSSTDIRIRGVSSITAGNDPLYVIDGVPMVNNDISADQATSSVSPLASINSNNIESVTVLKDASATAAYGARGANGVIVITTKSGKKGKTTFNFGTTYGFSNDAIKGPEMLTATQKEQLVYEGVLNTYGEAYGLADLEAAGTFYRDNIADATFLDWYENGKPSTNWGEMITNENAPVREHNFSARGGSDSYNFFASVGYFNQEATVIGSDFERITGQLNFGKDLTDKLKLTTTNSVSHSIQDGLLENSAYFSSPRTAKFFLSPYDKAYNEDGTPNTNLSGSIPNPLFIADQDIDDSKVTRFITNNLLSWKTPIKNLTFNTRANVDYIVYGFKYYRNPISGDGAGVNGAGLQTHNSISTVSFQNFIDYKWEVAENHQIDFKLLQEYQKNRNYLLRAEGENFADGGLTNLSSAGTPTVASSEFTDWMIASYLAMAHYSAFQGKYVVDATLRREGSSRFEKDNRWGNFWSVGAAWNIHREDFLANNDVISNLKLRTSYGLTGNANIDLNQYQALLGYAADYNGEGASYPATFGNKKLSWETSHTFDLGLEFGLLNNRINGAFGFYRRESKDLLLDVPLSLVTGFSSQTRNIGSMVNKGIELELDIDVIRGKDFNVNIGGNIATANNEVIELAKDLNGEEIKITNEELSVLRTETGRSVWSWYMPTWAGVNTETGLDEWFVNGVDGDKTTNFNEAERVFQGGSAIPKLTAGMNLHVDFKGVYLDVSGYYAGGHKVYEAWHRYLNTANVFSADFFNGYNTLEDRWRKPGDVARNSKAIYGAAPWQRHSKYLYDGAFFRLRNVTLGYNFDQSLLSKIKLEGLSVFVKGTNLATWVKDENLQHDPEVSALGQTSLTTPPTKSIIFGVNVKF